MPRRPDNASCANACWARLLKTKIRLIIYHQAKHCLLEMWYSFRGKRFKKNIVPAATYFDFFEVPHS